jgi:hypothetical protein
MSHTPGPWLVHDGDEIVTYDQRGTRWYIAACARYPTNDDTQRAANARLIAAAPELLALAKQYASECGECGGTRLKPTYDQGEWAEDAPCAECAAIWAVIDEAEIS